MVTPDDRKYALTHEWLMIEENVGTVGITDHAQNSLGDITFVELPTVGEAVKKGDECAVIESVKAASDIYSPATGIISEVNSAVEDSPETINKDPYGDGWIFRLENMEEAGELVSADEYEKNLDSE
ncbi:MAG: glycine cleavage system protein GcvH [Kiritimatiellia bacterium]|nr:glycine cleavage system protein GcvH [Kiritimatiellia bacterium]MDP6849145.1 glycine cleavage system protein GcvH [Kiritimatiellia bacterium]